MRARAWRWIIAGVLAAMPVAAAADGADTGGVAPAMHAKMLIARAKDEMRISPEIALKLTKNAQQYVNTERLADPLIQAELLWLNGEALLRLNEVKQAAEKVDLGLKIVGRTGKPLALRGDLLLSHGWIAALNANVAQALTDYQLAHNIFRALGEARRQAIALQQIASLYRQAGDLEEALHYDTQSFEVYHGDPGLDISNFNNRGNALHKLGRYAEADIQFRRALKSAESLGGSLLVVRIIGNIARNQLYAGHIGDSERTVRRGLALASKGDASGWRPQLLAIAAEAAFEQGHVTRAEALINESFAGVDLSNTSQTFGEAHETAYKIFSKLKRYDLALRHLEALKRIDESNASLTASASTALLAARFDYANQNLKIANLKAEDARRKFEFEQARGQLLRWIVLGIVVVALVGATGLILGIITLRRSRNEVRAANIELAASNDALEHALAAKTEFLATTSHEIRTPLNGILGMTQVMLTDRTLAPDVRDRLGIVHGAGKTMKALVDDILDVAKMETGNMTIEAAPVDLPATLRDVSRLWEAQARAKGIDFTLECGDCPEMIESDAARLRQIAFNLLSNALKFTEAGAIELRAAWDGEEHFTISVSDTGIGIPADKIEMIFESFRQVDAGVTRKYGGTGLGLAICRNLARAMGGDISVESALGRGSRFAVRLPYVPAVAADTAEVAPATGALIVDGNPIVRAMLRTLVEPCVQGASGAATLEEAEAAIAAGAPRLVLIDEAVVRAADEPFAAIAALVAAARERGAEVKLLWTSASLDEREALLRIGVADVIAKPIAGEALLGRLFPASDNRQRPSATPLVSRAA